MKKIIFRSIMMISILLWMIFIMIPTPVSAKGVKAKQYALSHEAGTYDDPIKLTIKAKKGYKIYYTTGKTFAHDQFIKSGKKKSVLINRDVTIRLYYCKKNVSLSKKKLRSKTVNKKARSFTYHIKNQTGDEGNGDEKDPSGQETDPGTDPGKTDQVSVTEDGVYTSKEEVAFYLYRYQKLPSNFITKEEARKLGWEGGGLDGYADGCCIGGDYFGNYEGKLPKGNYHECDIDTMHQKSRGAKRLVYSDTGMIYYTEDHYENFTLLYDGWEKK